MTNARPSSGLQRLYRIIRSWERWARSHAPADLQAFVVGRQRPNCWRRICSIETYPQKKTRYPFPLKKSSAFTRTSLISGRAFPGAMYVIEGSTLGGQYIARHVEQILHFRLGQGNAYFRGYSKRTSELWRDFKALLTALPETDSDTVIASAKATFSMFRDGLLS